LDEGLELQSKMPLVYRGQSLKHGFIVMTQTAIKLRAVQTELPGGEQEVLLTSVHD
jgi:hypothetical protein